MQDELCLLSPTFAPSFFYVGKLSIDIPLAWNFSRPVKMAVSDVLGVIRVCDHGSMQAEVRTHDTVSQTPLVCGGHTIIPNRQKGARLTIAKEALLLPLPRCMTCGVAEQ